VFNKALSVYENFDKLLEGFSNPPQFQEAVFETKVAYLFSLLPTISNLIFSPEHYVKGKLKRPEFDAISEFGLLSIECKRPHLHLHEAIEHYRLFVNVIKDSMKNKGWPNNFRLEIQIKEPFRKSINLIAEKIVSLALQKKSNHESIEMVISSVQAYVVPRAFPFILEPNEALFTNVMELNSDEATGIYNPRFTSLRIVNRNLDHRFSKSVGSLAKNALNQLPDNQIGFIFLGDILYKIAETVSKRRLDDPSYDKVKAFGVWNRIEFKFIFREIDSEFIYELMKGSHQFPLAA
jgi:hypothetical protein